MSDEAIDYRDHEKLVQHIARKLWHPRVEMEDLMASGQMGLLSAIEGFKPERGKWGTYAYRAIYREIAREANKYRGILHVPEDLCDAVIGRRNARASNRKKCFVDKARQALRRPINEGALSNAGEIRPIAEFVLSPSDHVAESDARLDVESLFQCLNSKQAAVVRLSFGLDGGGEREQPEVGAILGCSYQNVQQLLKKSITKMREAGRRRAS